MTSEMEITDCAVKKCTISKDEVRESLHMLQTSATNKENLVATGRIFKSTKQIEKAKTEDVILKKIKSSPSNKSKKSTFEDKAIQTVLEKKIQIEVEDLTSTAGLSENYWKVLAERRQIALENALEKISVLEEFIKKLKEQNERLKKEELLHEAKLRETRALIEVLQDMIESDSDGINNSLDDSVY